MLKKGFFYLLAWFIFLNVEGSHLRAGELVYKHVDGFTYEFIVNLYTKVSPPSDLADKCSLIVDWGHIASDTIIYRKNGPQDPSCAPGVGLGVMISNDVKWSLFKTTHTFPGPGSYTVRIVDPNLTSGVCNLPGSENFPICFEAYLVINSFVGGANSSPTFGHIPLDTACVGQIFNYFHFQNEIDGDSLVFEIIPSLGFNCQSQPGWISPDNPLAGGGTLSIDPKTGIITWANPVNPCGQYNFGVKVYEYRKIGSSAILVGYVVREMQFAVLGNCNNQPPVISSPAVICDTAGNTINFNVSAQDPEGHLSYLTSWGAPYNVSISPATFTITSTYGDSLIVGNFNWNTHCDHVSPLPYNVYFYAEDVASSGGNSSTYTQTQISVVALPPQNYQAVFNGSQIVINWSPAPCPNASCYKIYRHYDSIGYIPAQCITGVPPFTGYILVGTVSGYSNTIFIDDNSGNGFAPGTKVCYMITSCFSNGAESYPTKEFCVSIPYYAPLIIKASVEATSPTNGKDSIMWLTPIDLDTTLFPGPYFYRLYRDGILIWQSPPFNNLFGGDTSYMDSYINTVSSPHTYYVEIFSSNGAKLAGSSYPASTPFLTITPSKSTLTLNWSYSVPWQNYKHIVLKEIPKGSGNFSIIGITNTPIFVDAPLTNGDTFCYYVITVGKYPGVSYYPYALWNNSQIVCSVPWDYEPPCPPIIKKEGDTCTPYHYLTLIYDTACAPDPYLVELYYSPYLNGPYTKDTSFSPLSLTFKKEVEKGQGGCYFAILLDSFYNASKPSDTVCFDYCYKLLLPNVFTPNGDKKNDILVPIIAHNIERIEISIYDRWGMFVNYSSDMDKLWDGTTYDGKYASDGVYYYICTYYPKAVKSAPPQILKGFIHLISGGRIRKE